MKKILTFAAAAMLGLMATGCYDDSELKTRVDVLETKVSDLEALCKTMNNDVSELKTVMDKYKDAVTVMSVTATDNGYEIVFSDGTIATITNGEKGEKGDKGETGKKGDTGEIGPQGPTGDKGADAQTPVIGVKNEDGILYWTINGEYLLDDKGNKVSVAAPVTPQFKYVAEEETWYISLDGSEWKALSGKMDHCYLFKDVKEEDGKVVFTLQDGSTIEIPKEKPFAFTLSENKAVVGSGNTVEIPYTLTGEDETTIVDCIATGNITAIVNTEKKVIAITAPANVETGKVVVFATRGDKSIVRVINFVGCNFTIFANEITAKATGETITFKVTTDLEKDGYKVVIPADCKWISNVQTRALREDEISLDVAASLEAETRTAVLSLQTVAGVQITSLTIKQDAGLALVDKTNCKVITLDTDNQHYQNPETLFDGCWSCGKYQSFLAYPNGDDTQASPYKYKAFGAEASEGPDSFTIDAGKEIVLGKFVTYLYRGYRDHDPLSWEIYRYDGEGAPAQSGEWDKWTKIGSCDVTGVYTNEIKGKIKAGDPFARAKDGEPINVAKDKAARYYRYKMTNNGYTVYKAEFAQWWSGRTHWFNILEVSLYEYTY